MPTLSQPTRAITAQLIHTKEQSWHVREVQEAIREADNDDFATDDQVDAFFAKYDA